MSALDTSVCVPYLLSWHESHQICRRAAVGAKLPVHSMLETYSVLTRLPAGLRLSAEASAALLRGRFSGESLLEPPNGLMPKLLEKFAEVGIGGGAVYDALIAATAHEHGETLLTRDRRASRTYDSLEIEYELLDA